MIKDVLAAIPSLVARRVKRKVRRQMVSALLLGLALFFAGIAGVAGIAALWVVLAAHWGALVAWLMIACAALLLAVLLIGMVAWRSAVAQRRQQAERDQWQQTLLAAKAMVPDLSASNAMLIATVLGLLVGLTAGSNDPKDKS
jgi:MFS family permease